MYDIEQRDADLLGSTADIEYTLDFTRASQHLVHVTMRVRNITTETVVLVMPAWSPGSYKIRDYSAHQGNVEVFVGDARTKAPYQWRDKHSVVITTNGASRVEVSYVVYGLERSVRTNHINRNHAFIVPTATLMYVEGRMNEHHHVVLRHDRQVWPHVSTQLSPVTTGDGEVRLGAKNYDVLADSPLEIGAHQVRLFTVQGIPHELAVTASQPVDVDWLVDRVTTIVETEAQIFAGLPYDRYVFIVQVYPGAGGGLEHSRSSVNAVEPAAFLDKSKAGKLLSLLCHEFFHVWNVKRIRPVELGPFNYTSEVYTPMLWLAEGLTSYYDDLLHYRCGFSTEKEYLDTLANEHLAKLLRVQGRFRMSVRDSSRLAWVKLYQAGADANNRFPSYYLKGGVIMWLLDLYIISHSDGKASMDDALRALWQRYQRDPATGLTEAETIAILERATSVQLREQLLSWLDGTEELPIDEILAPFGLTLTIEPRGQETSTIGEKVPFAKVPPDVFVGWTLAEKSGDVVVRAVEDDGPAQRAGIGVDDEILSINGQRVTSVSHVAQLLAANGTGPATVQAQCDGVMYTTAIAPQHDMVVTISFSENLTDQQKHLTSVWLRRNT